jgi:hypothetical protein
LYFANKATHLYYYKNLIITIGYPDFFLFY